MNTLAEELAALVAARDRWIAQTSIQGRDWEAEHPMGAALIEILTEMQSEH